MKKKTKNEFWNLIFSAFLVAAFLVCSYFFIGIVNDSFAHEQSKKIFFTGLIFAIFGLILFYSTRVGDGKQVWRFSLAALVLMVLPSLYVMIASVSCGLPLHEQISSRSEVVNIAAVIFGYGIPYTFLSGYELAPEKKKEQPAESSSAPAEEDRSIEEIKDTRIPEETDEDDEDDETETFEEASGSEDTEDTVPEDYDIENFM